MLCCGQQESAVMSDLSYHRRTAVALQGHSYTQAHQQHACTVFARHMHHLPKLHTVFAGSRPHVSSCTRQSGPLTGVACCWEVKCVLMLVPGLVLAQCCSIMQSWVRSLCRGSAQWQADSSTTAHSSIGACRQPNWF